MSTVPSDKRISNAGNGQESFTPTCSERVQRVKNRVLRPMEICLERARAEMKALEQYKNEPGVIQRARIFETYLKEKTIHILEDDLIAGNITSKMRGASSRYIVGYNLEKNVKIGEYKNQHED